MLFFYLVFIVILLLKTRYVKDNEKYLNKDMTTVINGMFVITVFFSHFQTYIVNMNVYDEILASVLRFIGQLMVTSFLFYSGYGIYESIKNKKGYMDNFFRKRFIPTFCNFSLAVLLYIIVNLIVGNNYSIEKILLSFIGYESIGNSNWYMLAIFALYIMVLLCFNKKISISNNKKLIIISLLVIIYVYVISQFKDNYYVDTILCFPFGMWYSYFREKLDILLAKKYYICFVISFLLMICTYLLKNHFYNVYTYNIYAISFIVFIVFLTRKLYIKSSIITFFGVHTFWIYILQRIPMIILKDRFNNYIFFIICFVLTIILSYCMKLITDKLWKGVNNKRKQIN